MTDVHHRLVSLSVHSHVFKVLEGDFNTAEKLITEAAGRGLFNDFIGGYVYKPHWNKIIPSEGGMSVITQNTDTL